MSVGTNNDKVYKQAVPLSNIWVKQGKGVLMPNKKVLYEDNDIVVEISPRDYELPGLVYEAIKKKGRPVQFQELVKEFSGIVGEDRVRRAVNHLLALKKIVEFPDGTLGTPDMEWKPSGIIKRRRRRRLARLMDIEEPRKPLYTLA